MRQRLLFVASLWVCACSNSGTGSTTFGSSSGSSSGSGANAPKFTITTLTAVGPAGAEIAVASNGSKLAFATLAPLPLSTTNNCTIGDGVNSPTSSIQPVYNLWYGESTDGVTFSTAIVDTPMYDGDAPIYSSPSVALDSQGNPIVAYAGGIATDEASTCRRCGAALLLAKKGTGASFPTAATTLASGSQSASKNSEQNQCLLGNVCDAGDITGFDPSVVFDKSDKPLFVFRDLHFGKQLNDFATSDVEFLRDINPEQFLTADEASGGGIDNRIALLPNGNAAAAYANVSGTAPSGPGVWVATEKGPGDWGVVRVSDGNTGPHLGFAVNSKGRYSLAYYDLGKQLLQYTESSDGVTWSTSTDVDTTGSAGDFPSLAIDSNGEPAIAYYRCNSTVETQNCDASRDGLRVARRVNGVWQSHDASAQSGVKDGLNPALAFLNGKEVIVFQTTTFDPSTGDSSVELQVAKEQ